MEDKKLILNTRLVCKEPEYRTAECVVEKAIEIPTTMFSQMKQHPLYQYDNEPATVQLMHEFMEQEGYALDISDKRFHHEIYLSDARRVAPEKLRTVIRHPIIRL